MNSSVNMDYTFETIAAMRRQEDSGYLTSDYLHQSQPVSGSSSPNGPLNLSIDVECRDKMAAWCYQVIDFCKFNRETASIAMNFLDRFLCTPAGASAKADRKIFQLAAMTCLYTAVKCHEPEAMDPQLVSNLSRGTYSVVEIESMEVTILNALQWRVNTPTSLSFVRNFMDLIPNDMVNEATKKTAYEVTKYQTELTVSDYTFINTKQSTVAYCSLINTLEIIGIAEKIVQEIAYVLSNAIGLDCYNPNIMEVQTCLYQAVVRQEQLEADIASAMATSQEQQQQQQDEQSHCSSSNTSSNSAASIRKRRGSFDSSPRSTVTSAATVQQQQQ